MSNPNGFTGSMGKYGKEKRISLFFLPAILLISIGFSAGVMAQTISGRVTSQYGPVEEARVRIAGSDQMTLTDSQGRYVLQAAHPQRNLRVTAGKYGWFNNGVFVQNRETDIHLNPLYFGDQPDYRFISPAVCARCHTNLTRYWDKSKMAHTTSNPKVLDLYYGTSQLKQGRKGPGFKLDLPGSTGDCAVCHAPSAVAAGTSEDLREALLSPRTEWDGISCEFCHKIRRLIDDKRQPSGKKIILERQSPQRGSAILVFGPYDDVAVPPMAASYNPLYDKGEYCSACHTHVVPLPQEKKWPVDKIYSPAEKTAFGIADGKRVPLQTTYKEWDMWQKSLAANDPDKGKRCQDCHMSWRKDMLPYDEYIVDGSARMMWGTQRSPRNIHPHQFDGGTETQLKTAVAMEIEGKIIKDRLKVSVFVTNSNGGHWVPTGEPMRSIMLVVNAHGSDGKPLKFVKGERLPDWTGQGDVKQGSYAGLPGRVFARVLKDAQGNLNVPAWRAVALDSDTRIRPKTTLRFDYEFDLPATEDEPTAEASLIYRPVAKTLAAEKDWQIDDIMITQSVW